MELAGVAERLRNKTVLITGAPGFIAKLLVEKILRLQPEVKRLFLLVRAGDQISAVRRVQSDSFFSAGYHVRFCNSRYSELYKKRTRENSSVHGSGPRFVLWQEMSGEFGYRKRETY